MNAIFEKQVTILPSIADAEGRLSVPGCFGLFMDLAAEHAEKLGCGFEAMREKGLFWLTVRTRLCFHERPRLSENVTLRTWPEAPGRLRCLRSYQLLRGDEVLISGKTEWAVLNIQDNSLAPAAGVYPEGLAYPAESACPGVFAHIPDNFGDLAPFAAYTVRSTDIDVGGHMNNVAYIHALAGSFSGAEWRALPLACVDVSFRAPCFEGDALAFRRREGKEGLEVRLSRGDSPVFFASLS